MTTEFWLLLGIGFFAQLIDGALGMAFGVISTAAMLAIGLPPAQASALVHTAEIFTTGASAASHIYHRNVDWRLVARLGVAGVLGAALGAWPLQSLIPLVIGGLLAAPIGGWAVKRIPVRAFMIAVGGLLLVLSGWQLARVTGIL